MSRYVVDASVAVKWFVPERLTDAAVRLLNNSHDLLAPDLLLPEVGNILWKKMRRGQITDREANNILRGVMTVPFSFHPSLGLIAPAFQVAAETARTVYDSLYLALAVLQDCRLVTADGRFYAALHDGPFRPYLRWIEDEL